jgi:hypothetical protein
LFSTVNEYKLIRKMEEVKDNMAVAIAEAAVNPEKDGETQKRIVKVLVKGEEILEVRAP